MVKSISNVSNFDNSDKKVSQGFSIVKHALEAAHQLSKAQVQTTEIRKALESADYNSCYNVAQKFLKKYRKMLNSYTFLTGVSIIDITLEEARSKSIDYWKDALKYAEMLIYADVAIHSGLKSVIEEKLKRIFLQKNNITTL